jgi:hypothetical protein
MLRVIGYTTESDVVNGKSNVGTDVFPLVIETDGGTLHV